MIVTYLELYRYKRTRMNASDRLVYTPKSPEQLIIGRNGSGKSSLQRCLLPHAQNKRDFLKGGHYIHHSTHNGSDYELSSTFVDSPHHSFICDGEELNRGGTSTVQNELIFQHFGIDKDVIALLMGDIKFTSMGPMKRREWFMRLSNTNLDYVLGVYSKAKKKTTETKGVVNHFKEKLQTETGKLKQEIDLANMQEEIDYLQNVVSLIHKEMSTDWNDDLSLDHLDFVIKSLDDTVLNLLRVDLSPPVGYRFDGLESVRQSMEQNRVERSDLVGRQKGIASEANELDRIVQAAKGKEGETTVEGLKKEKESLAVEMETLDNEIQRHVSQITAKFPSFQLNGITDGMTPTAAHEMFYHVDEVLAELPATEEPVDYQSKIAVLEEEKRAIFQNMTHTRNKLSQVEARLEHNKNCEKVNCPRCTHEWRPGVDEEVHKKALKLQEHFTKEIEDTEAKIKKCDQLIGELREKRESVQRFFDIKARYSQFKGLWDLVYEEGLYHKDPASHRWVYEVYVWLVEKGVRLGVVKTRYKEIETVLSEVEKHQTHGKTIGNRLRELDDLYRGISKEMERYDDAYRELQKYLQRVEAFLSGLGEVARLKDEMYTTVDGLLVGKRNQLLSAESKKFQLKLSHAHAKLTEHQTIERLVEDTKKSLEKATDDLSAWKLLVKSLSPTEGVIADQLHEFLGVFIEEINRLIDDVWTYSLVVKNCTEEDGDLDYYFPLDVMNGEFEPTDVKHGSSGQSEIVDLAFKIVAQLSLGLNDIPLLQDEPGRTFDAEHFGRYLHYLKQLMESGVFPQLFLISHSHAGYGTFTHAEHMVMDKENIVQFDKKEVETS